MLRSVKNLIGYPIEAVDGDIGKVADCLFDDQEWGLRYLVVSTGGWFGSKVLLSPRDLDQPEVGWYGRHFPVKLSRKQIRKGPPLSSDRPISQDYEAEYAQYYRHHFYWEGGLTWGSTANPDPAGPSLEAIVEHQERLRQIEQRHIRSVKEIVGYRVHAADGFIGHVDDFVLEAATWVMRQVVVDLHNYLPGKKVLVDIDWIRGFDWARNEAVLDLPLDKLRESPAFDPHTPINRDSHKALYDYHGKPCEWEEPTGPSM